MSFNEDLFWRTGNLVCLALKEQHCRHITYGCIVWLTEEWESPCVCCEERFIDSLGWHLLEMKDFERQADNSQTFVSKSKANSRFARFVCLTKNGEKRERNWRGWLKRNKEYKDPVFNSHIQIMNEKRKSIPFYSAYHHFEAVLLDYSTTQYTTRLFLVSLKISKIEKKRRRGRNSLLSWKWKENESETWQDIRFTSLSEMVLMVSWKTERDDESEEKSPHHL